MTFDWPRSREPIHVTLWMKNRGTLTDVKIAHPSEFWIRIGFGWGRMGILPAMKMLPKQWNEYSSRAPPQTQVSDDSGQLLKVNAEVSVTISVSGIAMEYDFLVVKSLSIPLILGWDFQRNFVDTVFPTTHTIKWDNGTSSLAVRSWTGTTRPAHLRRENNPKAHIGAIRLPQGVTVGPRCIQAVRLCCNFKAVHLVRERPVQMGLRKVLLHNAIVEVSRDTPWARLTPSRRSAERVLLTPFVLTWTTSSRSTRRFGRGSLARSTSPRIGSR